MGGTTEHFVKSFTENKKQEQIPKEKQEIQPTEINQSAENFLDQIKVIPLRLNDEERKILSLLEAALNISEYTDRVDVSRSMTGYGFGFMSFSSFGRSSDNEKKEKIIRRELNEVFSLVSGLYTATDFR